MYQVEDEPIETIHLYVIREGDQRPSPTPAIICALLSVFTLSLLIAIGILLPYQQPEQRVLIRVPAVLLPLKTFATTVTIIPTGVRIIPTTQAQGILTIYNGSILSQELPQGLIIVGKDGTEIITESAVVVPPGNPPNFGIASVRAHSVTGGQRGNIQSFDVDEVYGSSLYIRNLQPFIGGNNAQKISFITTQDRQNALSQARDTLMQRTTSGLLTHPCKESATGLMSLTVAWICQFVAYETPRLPGLRVLHASVEGATIVLEVVFMARPHIISSK